MYDKLLVAKRVASWLKRPGVLGIPAALIGAVGASVYPYLLASEPDGPVQRAEDERAVRALPSPAPSPTQLVKVPQCAPAATAAPKAATTVEGPTIEATHERPRADTPREVLPAGYDPASEPSADGIEPSVPDTELADATPPAGFTVQVASFPTKESADRIAEQLVRRGLPARAAPYGFASGKWWHSVRLGPFPSRVEAERRRLELLPGERAGAVVLPRSRGAHFVQFASLRSRESAEKLASKLSSTGHQLRVDAVTAAQGEKWHCVRIGPFDGGSEAEGFRRLLAERDGIEGVVVPYEPKPNIEP